MKAENSWLVAKVIVCKWKSVTLKFCIPRNERKKKTFINDTQNYFIQSSTKRMFLWNALKNSLSLVLSFYVIRSFPHTFYLFLLLAHITVSNLRYIKYEVNTSSRFLCRYVCVKFHYFLFFFYYYYLFSLAWIHVSSFLTQVLSIIIFFILYNCINFFPCYNNNNNHHHHYHHNNHNNR